MKNKNKGTYLNRVIGNNLKKTRSLKNISQAQLSAMCEVPRALISSIENAERCPSIPTLLSICESLESSLSEIAEERFFSPNDKYENLNKSEQIMIDSIIVHIATMKSRVKKLESEIDKKDLKIDQLKIKLERLEKFSSDRLFTKEHFNED